LGAQPQHTHKRLSTFLLEAGVVTAEQIEEGLARQRDSGDRIGETLVQMGFVSEEDIGWALSRQLDLTFVDPHLDALDLPLIQEYPEELLRRLQAVPLVRLEHELEVALADPLDQEAIEELRRHSERPLGISVATPTTIRVILDRVFGVQHSGAETATGQLRLVTPDRDLAWERSGTQFLRFHLLEALKWRAAEIHFVPTDGQLGVFYRIGSDLNAVAREQLLVLDFLQIRLDALGMPAMDKDVRHLTGRITHELDGRELDIEISMVRSGLGTAITLQPRWRESEPPLLAYLGLTRSQEKQVSTLLAQPAGCLLISGPRRCGGSTSLASLVASAGLGDRRVIVFERQRSIPLPGVLNLQLNASEPAERWQEIAAAQCADVVVLDGILCGKQIEQILSPAASGRLLLVRTDWIMTRDLLSFLIAASPSRDLLSRRLLGVIQQRLVRFPDSDQAMERQGLPFWQRGVFEVLALDEECRQGIREEEDLSRLFTRAVRQGYTTLADECRRLVETHQLSAIEAARVLT
jgi:type II secretory ATPase GspE/PulE/Tfp pilus assembly ATPase PilB-like protein